MIMAEIDVVWIFVFWSLAEKILDNFQKFELAFDRLDYLIGLLDTSHSSTFSCGIITVPGRHFKDRIHHKLITKPITNPNNNIATSKKRLTMMYNPTHYNQQQKVFQKRYAR